MKRKGLKRIVASAFAIVLSATMLLGATFAYFTDSTSSSNNIIASGNLKVNAYWMEGTKNPETDTWTNFESGAIFDNDKWEPGYVEAKHVKISNEGNLALKYQLAIVPTGEVSKLAEVIDVYLYEIANTDANATQVATRFDVDATMFVGTLKDVISKGIVQGSLNAFDDYTTTIVLKMQETANNDYQGLSIGDDFSIQVLATQFTNESDSIDNQYDNGAWMPGMQVYTAQDLQSAINVGEDIVLMNDIELADSLVIPAPKARSIEPTVIDLNGNTISGTGLNAEGKKAHVIINYGNLTITGGTIESTGENGGSAIYNSKNATLNLNDASVVGASQSGNAWPSYAINNYGTMTIDNADITSTHGALSLYGDTIINNANVVMNGFGGSSHVFYIGGEGTDVVVNDGTYTHNGNVDGSLAYIMTGTTMTINGGSFYASNGGYGLATYTGSLRVNGGYFANAFLDWGGPISIAGGTFKVKPAEKYLATGYAINTNQDGTFSVYFPQESVNDMFAKPENNTIELPKGEYQMPSLADKESLTIIGAEDGSTVIGGENTTTGFGSNFGKDTTIKNLTFSGASNGVRYSYAKGGDTTFDNCTFAGGSTYGFHIDQSNSATFTFNNCTFIGFNAFAGDLVKVVFNNCTFLSNGNYGHTNIWSVAEFNNCTWGDNTSVGQGKGSNAKLYFNGVEESYHHEYIGSAESLFAFAESVNVGNDSWNGQKVILVADIDLENAPWTPIGQTGATEFKGIFDGQNHTIKNLYVDNTDKTDEYTSTGLFGWAESGVTIQNVKVDGATVKGNHNVATLVGYTYSAKIINCHVSNTTVVCTHANGDACGDKAGAIVGYAGPNAVITNCSASISTIVGGRDAGQVVGAGYSACVSGCSATEVSVSAGGDCNKEGNINNDIIGRLLG